MGFEKLSKDSHLAKACSTVRPVELVKKRTPAVYNGTRASFNKKLEMVPVFKKPRFYVNNQNA